MTKDITRTRESFSSSPEASPDVGCLWSRLPKAGAVEPRSGLNRSAINSLILGESPKVKSTTLRKHPGAKRAVRLVKILGPGGLLEYLEGSK